MTTTTFQETIAPSSIGTRIRALPKRAFIVAGAAIVLALTGAWWITLAPSSVSTDDAYLKADSTIIAPKVHGLVAAILVHDNQVV